MYPSPSRILSKRWASHTHQLHIQRLNAVRSRIDSASPQPRPHLHARLKQHQLAEDRFTEIERANRLLLEKMTVVLAAKAPEFPCLRKRSLNRAVRKRAVAAISSENQALLQRLKQRQATYSAAQWKAREKKTEELLRLRCEFPYQLTPRPRTRSNTPLATRKPRSARPDEERTVLYRGEVLLQNRAFRVEMSANGAILWIVAVSREDAESYSTEVPYAEALALAGSGDVSDLLSHLRLEGGELVLGPLGAATAR